MIITAYGQHHNTPPHTPKQAEEFMVNVANPFWFRVSVANECPVSNLEILKAATNGPLAFEGAV